MAESRFVTAINCMDGRVQLPVIAWLKADTGADYVDNITEPGPVKILAEGRNRVLLGSIRRRVKISVERHGSRLVAIIAHHDCAGNPVDEQTQRRQLERAIRRVESWGLGVRVVGLWVNEQWQVEG
ncbi:MAG: carbonic anhydrase [candidate division WOR-3 bacterium]